MPDGSDARRNPCYAGYRFSTGTVYDVTSFGGYWSRTPNGYNGYTLRFDSGSSVYPSYDYRRYYGFAVRCLPE